VVYESTQTGAMSPFGSRARTKALLALALMVESYPRELARIVEMPLFSVQKALASLERDQLLTSRLLGRTRLYGLNPRYLASRELREYLERLTAREFDLRRRIGAVRGRA
jgi:DNA-binding transcriptional ArsR family regulator